MYYASQYTRTKKNKVPVSVVTMDGEIFDGSFFVTGDQRVKDLLNGNDLFLPFETLGGALYLVNRTAISRVIPRKETTEVPQLA